MSKGSYFSQYESPNIVIVPTTSPCKPPSPKRQKVGNNIVVPILDNVSSDLQELNVKEANKKPKHEDVDSKNTESSSISPSLNTSWASKYLQSIGLDKKSSVWNRKIPRKSSGNVPSMPTTPALTSEVSSTSRCNSISETEKCDQNKTPNKTITNVSKDKSHTKTKRITDVKKDVIKNKPKVNKQLKRGSLKSVLVRGTDKGVKNLNRLTVKNNSTLNIQNDLKTNNSAKKDIHNQEINECKITENNNINKTTQKAIYPKPLTKTSSMVKKTPETTPKTDIESVVVKKNHARDKGKSIANHNPTNKLLKSTSSRPVDYKDKYKKQGCSAANVSPVVKVTQKSKFNVSKKARSNIELKTKTIQDQTEIMNNKEKLLKTKSDSKSNKTNESPKSNKMNRSLIKKIVPKTKKYRKIKLVINLICNNKANPVQSNETESNKCNSTCTIPNVDLDFLNDFNIDEIVESLYTGDKQSTKHIPSDREFNKCQNKRSFELNSNNVKSNIRCTKTQSDATDLIKILKGEEDDDLVRMTMESANTLPSNTSHQVFTQCIKKSQTENSVLNSKESEILNNELASHIRIKEEALELCNPLEIIESTGTINLPCEKVIKNDMPEQFDMSLNAVKIEKFETKQQSKVLEDVTLSDISIVMESICEEVDKNMNKIYENVKESSHLTLKTKQHPAVNAGNVDNSINININSKLQKNCPATENRKDIDGQIINDKTAEVLSDEHQRCPVLRYDDKNALFEHQNANSTTTQNTYLRKVSANVNKKIDNNNDENFTDYNVDNNVIKNTNDLSTSTNNSDNSKIKNITNQVSYLPKDVYKVENVSKSKNDNSHLTNEIMNINRIEKNETQSKLPIVSIRAVEKEENTNQNSLQKTRKDDKEEGRTESLNNDNIKNNHTVDTEQNYTQEDKQNKMSDNVTIEHPNTTARQDETTQSNVESNINKEIFKKLEDRLVKCTGSKYSISTIIHAGKYSDIFQCKHPNGKYYALKMLKNTKYYLGKEKLIMMKSLIRDIPKDNLFIINLVNASNVAKKWCFLMEFYPNNLSQLMDNGEKTLFIEQIQDFARQLVMAVMVLKNNNMVHLDIKPNHVLISSSNKTLKLTGFDTLCYINELRILPNVGTVNYRAPEVILGYAAGFEIDVWSTALVIYEMAANRKLFPGTFNNDILYKQICTLGRIPYDMLRKSRFSNAHFVGSKFMKKSGIKGKNINIISKFHKNNILNDSIYNAYFVNWGHKRRFQLDGDMAKLNLLVKMLQKMLTVHPQFRLPIEFVYANKFIYEAYSSYEEW